MTRYFAGRIPDDQWRTLLTHCLAEADTFVVHMPDGDGPLSHGRHEVRALPGVTVAPWPGMAEAIAVTGPLTTAARDLFRRTETSLTDYYAGEKLWDYRLIRDGEEILSIGDFADLVVALPDEELAGLRIDTSEWN